MPKNPLSWLSLPALLTILAYIGCQPRDLQKFQQELTRQAWLKLQQQAQNGMPQSQGISPFGMTNANDPYPYPASTSGNPNYGYYASVPSSGYESNYPVNYGHPQATVYSNSIQTRGYDSVQADHYWRAQPRSNSPDNWSAGTQLSRVPTVSPYGSIQTNYTSNYRPMDQDVPFDERCLIIGTFNIKAFGRAKLSNSSVMEIIVAMIRRFDLIAIQEIRSEEQIIIPTLVQMLNSTGLKYDYYVGERLGYTTIKEQYAYIYDTTKLRLTHEPFTTQTRTPMHRAPLAARFQVTQLNERQAFTFTLLNVHTDPDEVREKNSSRNELRVIKEAIDDAKAKLRGEDDFIVLGDFNAPTDFMAKFFPWFASPIYVVKDDWVTNVRENKNYDNIVFDARYTTEYDGRCGVFNFRREYQLSEEDALQVSDHFPVWATFSIFENGDPNMVAGQIPQQRPR